jgi:hypothetical protein
VQARDREGLLGVVLLERADLAEPSLAAGFRARWSAVLVTTRTG